MQRGLLFVAVLLTLAFCGQLGAAEPPATIKVIFVGDMMLAELPGEAIASGVDPYAPFDSVFKQADITLGNLECVVATTGEKVPKPYNFEASPRCIPVLKKHFTAVTIANNHSGDYGKGALAEQCDLLEQAKLPYFGGGRDSSAAHTPLILERNGIRLALLGYNEFKPRIFEAGATTPGIAWSVDQLVVDDIHTAREKYHADLVIPFMHWGWEYEEISDRQRSFGRTMIDAGADAVVGAHPHVRQAIEYYHGKPIFYSLGDFVFNGFHDEETLTGWVLQLTLDKTGVGEWKTMVAHLDDRGLPHLVEGVKSPHGDARKGERLDYDPPYPKHVANE
ncbi:MAG TPA: CapA family protein [Pirellulales bacterium]|nr:CapA family protein [Pirellulales bacterium]